MIVLFACIAVVHILTVNTPRLGSPFIRAAGAARGSLSKKTGTIGMKGMRADGLGGHCPSGGGTEYSGVCGYTLGASGEKEKELGSVWGMGASSGESKGASCGVTAEGTASAAPSGMPAAIPPCMSGTALGGATPACDGAWKATAVGNVAGTCCTAPAPANWGGTFAPTPPMDGDGRPGRCWN